MGKYFKNLKPYYVDSSSAVYLSDTFDALADMYAESIDMVFAIRLISSLMEAYPVAAERLFLSIKANGIKLIA